MNDVPPISITQSTPLKNPAMVGKGLASVGHIKLAHFFVLKIAEQAGFIVAVKLKYTSTL